MRFWCNCLVAIFVCLAGTTARAEIFTLKTGGQVRGELLNKEENPRKTYEIQTPTGGRVVLEASQVKSMQRQSPAQSEYDRVRWQYDDSVEQQWKLAEWCREHKLTKERSAHLEKIIELDPNHQQARHALGYSQIEGKWTTEREHMEGQGYVRYNGRWRLPQEVALVQRDEKNERAEKDWMIKVKRWRGWLQGDKPGVARENFLAIRDPFAVKALGHALKNEQVRSIKLLYIDALANINTGGAYDTLVIVSTDDSDDEVRVVALDKVVRVGYKPAVATYVQRLKSRDNELVNRAGAALGSMKDPSAIGPLIDALVTAHEFVVKPGGNPGEISSTFGSGPGGTPGSFNFGEAKTEVVKRRLTNPLVLDALVQLSGVNFNFDMRAWKYWFVSQKKPATLDARRD